MASPNLANVLFGSGLFGDGRLRNLIDRYVTDDLLKAVAEEHAKGRRLLVVTTNLDSQRAVIWNMGAIAASGVPNARQLFRDVLAASASIPAVFPPQFIDVSAGDARFQEMHVDGSVVTPVFTLPQTLLLRDGRIRTGGKAEIYVVINGRLEPDFEVTKDNTLSIVERSFTTASRARSRATLTATYALARTNGIGFNLTYIDENGPKASAAKGFDTAYMRALYEAGYEKGRTGAFWQHLDPRRAGAEGDGERRGQLIARPFRRAPDTGARRTARLLAQDLRHEAAEGRRRAGVPVVPVDGSVLVAEDLGDDASDQVHGSALRYRAQMAQLPQQRVRRGPRSSPAPDRAPQTCMRRMLLVLPAVWNGMPAVTTMMSFDRAKPSSCAWWQAFEVISS